MNVPIVITLFLILSGASYDEYILARAIEGEAAPFVKLNPEIADRVGVVALNRLNAGWCSNIENCVLDGFWGIRNVRIPNQAALESAQRVLKGEANQTNDLFVFSLQDCEALNLDMNLATAIATKRNWTLVFFKNDIVLKEKQ
jgi:hypothetical protein